MFPGASRAKRKKKRKNKNKNVTNLFKPSFSLLLNGTKVLSLSPSPALVRIRRES
jgi:hypothetical protein